MFNLIKCLMICIKRKRVVHDVIVVCGVETVTSA